MGLKHKDIWTMKYSKRVLLGLIIACGLNAITANACTVLTIKDKQGATYQGRTMEFVDFPFYVNYFPKLTKFTSKTPKGEIGLEFVAKYAFIGVSGSDNDTPDAFITDGVNSSGLTIAFNVFGEGKLPPVSQPKALNAIHLGSWILSQFSSVNEVKAALSKQQIWHSSKLFPKDSFPFHVAIFDRSGKGIVIEYINGKQVIHDNPVGVLTNGPDFNWHLTNLNNYTGLSNTNTMRANFNSYSVKAEDIGGNLMGLPSDDMSSGRFVRAAFYSNYAQRLDKKHAIASLGKIMNKFDRIRGVSIDKEGVVEFAFKKPSEEQKKSGEWVVWTSLIDLDNSTYYIRPDHSLNYCKFELNKIEKQGRAFSLPISKLVC